MKKVELKDDQKKDMMDKLLLLADEVVKNKIAREVKVHSPQSTESVYSGIGLGLSNTWIQRLLSM